MNNKPNPPVGQKSFGHGKDSPSKPSPVVEQVGYKSSAWPLPWDVRVELARIRLQMAKHRYIADQRKVVPPY